MRDATQKSNATPQRQIRIADAIWFKAAAKARSEGRGVSEVVRGFLADYVADWEDPDAAH